ncbi:streptomycin 3'-adenylyltransferase [Jeotgalibacillus terrae]|nr:aminoglycoside adenylyltransferase domain-containing protein [Jeotgalibacillus terrae]MBM7578538.1 streptomycin 3'-adenylyltransferase [Jeotgalibacillus terrae]
MMNQPNRSVIDPFLSTLQNKISHILQNNLTGIYIHGSLAMGGFNPNHSDIDLLVVTEEPISVETKRELAGFFLMQSNRSAYPIEVSFLNTGQLKKWSHPSPFDFHYSEFWRERYEQDLSEGTDQYLNDHVSRDPDLAAHITILNHRGLCLYGRPIHQVFPEVPAADYLSSIMNDVRDCIEHIEEDPVYCILNMLRVYWYIKSGVISSKQETGEWGVSVLSGKKKETVEKALLCYKNSEDFKSFEQGELIAFREYMKEQLLE